MKDIAQAQSLPAEPVGWWSKLYGFVFMHLQPHQFEIGSTLYLKDGTPAWRVESTCSKTALISTSGLPHGTVFYSSPPVAQAQSLPDGWKPLTDVQWMNIVNLNQAWFGYSVEDAVHEVVQLTEARLKMNNAASPAQPVQPCETQWQKRHPLRTKGNWENTNEHDAKWRRDNSQGWEIRVLYANPVAQAKPVQPAAAELTECKLAYESQFKELHALKAQRDALLEALKGLVSLEADGRQAAESAIEYWEAARAAIAAAGKGGAS